MIKATEHEKKTIKSHDEQTKWRDMSRIKRKEWLTDIEWGIGKNVGAKNDTHSKDNKRTRSKTKSKINKQINKSNNKQNLK